MHKPIGNKWTDLRGLLLRAAGASAAYSFRKLSGTNGRVWGLLLRAAGDCILYKFMSRPMGNKWAGLGAAAVGC